MPASTAKQGTTGSGVSPPRRQIARLSLAHGSRLKQARRWKHRPGVMALATVNVFAPTARAAPPMGARAVAGAVGDQQRPFGSGTVPAGGRGVTLPSGRGKPQRP